jgi:hypothetical protein
MSAGALTTEKPPLIGMCPALPAMEEVGSEDIVICSRYSTQLGRFHLRARKAK